MLQGVAHTASSHLAPFQPLEHVQVSGDVHSPFAPHGVVQLLAHGRWVSLIGVDQVPTELLIAGHSWVPRSLCVARNRNELCAPTTNATGAAIRRLLQSRP